MKLLLSTLVLAAGLGLSFGFTPHVQEGGDPPLPGKDPASPPMDDLVDRALEMQNKIARLEAEQAGLRETLGAVISYLEQRSDAAASMSKSLDSVEAKGFTAGINPNSREVLLSSWRTFLAAEGQTLPKLAPAPKPIKPGTKRPGRRPAKEVKKPAPERRVPPHRGEG